MKEFAFHEAVSNAQKFGGLRPFPTRQNARYSPLPNAEAGMVMPLAVPRFKVTPGDKTFSIGPCFLRNVETHLRDEFGCRSPVLDMDSLDVETGSRGPFILNEYNLQTLCQRIHWACGEVDLPDDLGIDMSMTTEGYRDLLITAISAEVPLDLLFTRREHIKDAYAHLVGADTVFLAPGNAESWFDRKYDRYINTMPALASSMAEPDRFAFRRAEYQDAFELLKQAVSCLLRHGVKKVFLIVAPTPQIVSLAGDDVFTANGYAKSVLRCAVEAVWKGTEQVDYIPLFEMANSAGTAGYIGNSFQFSELPAFLRFLGENYVSARTAPTESSRDIIAHAIHLAERGRLDRDVYEAMSAAIAESGNGSVMDLLERAWDKGQGL